MDYIGITTEQVESILEESGIRTGELATAEGTRTAIAKVIVENNKKLLDDVLKLISENKNITFT